MFIRDAAKAISREKTPDGFLRVRARIGRAGIQLYRARDVGSPSGHAPDATLRVFRPVEEVFDPASMASFGGVPVTLDHPPAMVDATNWKLFAVGHAGPEVAREGDHLAADLVITDAAAVARAEQGAELSNGYWADFDFEPGRTPDGEAFDAVQRNIRGNHVALVDEGRCGPSCRIDAADAGDPGPCGCASDAATAALGTVLVDGVAIDTTPDGAAAIGRVLAALDEVRRAHRRDVAVRDGEIAALKTAAPGPAALDALVGQRAAVIEGARAVLGHGFDPHHQGVDAIRRAVVAAVLGAERARDASEDSVTAAFDALVAGRAPGNVLAAQFAAASSAGGAPHDSARRQRDRFLAEAWKGARG